MTIHRRFPQSLGAVWKAWTDPELINLWFGSDPNGMVLHARLDVRVGGSFEITFRNSDQTEFTCFGTYQSVIPCQQLGFSWKWKNTPEVTEFVSVRLDSEVGGTNMIFEHTDIDPHTSHGYEAGWNRTFDKLAQTLVHVVERR